MNSFYQSESFKEKKVLVIVPHMDDEINVAGSMIHNLSVMECNISVLYTTNGNGGGKGKVRIKEAKEALRILTGKDIELIVCDYMDQPRCSQEHILSKNKMQIENRMKEFILLNKPNIIICVDLDEHPDHMRTSIAFEKVMGQVLKRDDDYKPIIYKGFAYKTAYFSHDDIDQGPCPLLETKCYKGKLDNPMYSFKERVRFPVLRECTFVDDKLSQNVIAKALKAHKTQNAERHIGQIVNSDIVFFERRTDSLSYSANITVSSGNGAYLNDFAFLDVENVMSRNRVYTDYLWVPDKDDKDRKIRVEFTKKVSCNHIVLYQSLEKKSRIEEIEISFDDGMHVNWCMRDDGNLKEDIYFNKREIGALEIQIKKSIGNAGISELEIYNDEETIYDYIKIMQDNNFVYRLVGTKSALKYDVYGYHHKYGSEIVPCEKIQENIFHKGSEGECIRIHLKNNPEVYEEIPVDRISLNKYIWYCYCKKIYQVRGMLKDVYNNMYVFYRKCRMLLSRFGL